MMPHPLIESRFKAGRRDPIGASTTKRREVSGADSWQCSKRPLVGAFYSITSSARASTDGGTVGGLSEPIFVAASERGLERGCWGLSQSKSRTKAAFLRKQFALSVAIDPGP